MNLETQTLAKAIFLARWLESIPPCSRPGSAAAPLHCTKHKGCCWRTTSPFSVHSLVLQRCPHIASALCGAEVQSHFSPSRKNTWPPARYSARLSPMAMPALTSAGAAPAFAGRCWKLQFWSTAYARFASQEVGAYRRFTLHLVLDLAQSRYLRRLASPSSCPAHPELDVLRANMKTKLWPFFGPYPRRKLRPLCAPALLRRRHAARCCQSHPTGCHVLRGAPRQPHKGPSAVRRRKRLPCAVWCSQQPPKPSDSLIQKPCSD